MGKHSKARTPLLRAARTPLFAAAMIPLVGACAAGATAATDQHRPAPTAAVAAPAATQAPATSSVTVTPAPSPSPSATSAPTPTASTPPPPPMPPSVQDGSVPAINYRAYRSAADSMARTHPTCGIPWTLIAGIGKVESHHANFGAADASGRLRAPIFGPTLNGSLSGNQVVTDTDGGRLDGDAAYDRALGPMQFLPSTWEKFAADGNGDGQTDPQNLFDAALTTARYLCDGNLDLRRPASEVSAVLRYNNSMEYVDNVLGFARGYTPAG